MTRLHLIELEDQPWVPRTLRDGATDLLDVLFARIGMYRPLAPALGEFMQAAGQRRWLDLCSGGGGGALAMRDALVALGQGPDDVSLTDRYPNAAARARVAVRADPSVRYRPEPIDAMQVPPHPAALRTMFGAVHHFPPAAVQRVLQAAVAERVPIAFVDVAASPLLRAVPVALVPVAALPNFVVLLLIALLLTPLARPFRWSRLVWTYLVPAIPILFAWDGTVSALRAYTPEELLALARAVPGGGGYTWDARRAGQALMLTGRPSHSRTAG